MSSIRRNVIISIFLIIAGGALSAGIWTYKNIQNQIYHIFDEKLIAFSYTLLNVTEQNLNDLKQLTEQERFELISNWRYQQANSNYIAIIQSTTSPENQMYANELPNHMFQVFENDGPMLTKSELAPTELLSEQLNGFSIQNIYNADWMVYSVDHYDTNLIIQVAQRLEVRDFIINKVTLAYVIPLLMMCIIILIAIWYILGQCLQPLYQLVNELNDTKLGNMAAIKINNPPLELKVMTNSINNLLNRLTKAFEEEKRFNADAAHELRTPLAAIKTQAQVALRNTDNNNQHAAIEQVILGVDRSTRTVEQLLTLSKIDNYHYLTKDHKLINLHDSSKLIISDLINKAIQKNIEVSLSEVDESPLILGNQVLIDILLRNLIDNAIRYTPNGGQVNISVIHSRQRINFIVTDTGPGIPAELRERVFKRFYRQLGTKASGSGLGLSIVQKIADLHQATIILESSSKEGGLKITVAFPKPPED